MKLVLAYLILIVCGFIFMISAIAALILAIPCLILLLIISPLFLAFAWAMDVVVDRVK